MGIIINDSNTTNIIVEGKSTDQIYMNGTLVWEKKTEVPAANADEPSVTE